MTASNAAPLFRMDPVAVQDPYPMYARLREVDPIHRAGPTTFIVTRYADLVAVLKDPRFGRAGLEASIARAHGLGDQRMYILPAMFADPPDHTRLRAVLTRAFTLRVVEALTPRIEQVTNDLLDRSNGQSEIDLIQVLAYKLPLTTLCHLLGMPDADHERIHELSEAHSLALSARTRDEIERLAPRAQQLRVEWAEYFRQLVEKRRGGTGNDLITELVRVHDGGEKLTEYELLATIVGLLFAGHTTTADSIGTGVLALLTHRDQWERLVKEPNHLDSAVEEVLRWDSAVQTFIRIALEDAEVAGTPVPKGATVMTVAGSANRDPAQFVEPERFDITRSPNRHVAFGSGIHFCLGSTLARTQIKIALNALCRRYPNLSLAGDGPPQYRPTLGFRGLTRLDVKL